MIRVEPAAFVLAAALVLLLPPGWLLAAVTAACIHEIGHLAVIFLCGGRMEGLTIGPGGAKIRAGPLENRAEFFCAAAGPAASLLLVCLCHSFPRLALCGLVQGMFNLLPVHPMDGGRMLRCALERLCPGRAAGICRAAAWLTVGGLAVLGLWLWGKSGPLPALACLAVFSRLGKIPCKSGGSAVQ